nr:hypothetical protein [Tanacetum cinerariifolium]
LGQGGRWFVVFLVTAALTSKGGDVALILTMEMYQGACKLLKKMSQRSRDFREILNESSVKTCVTEETSNTLDGCGMRQFSNYIDFGSVDLNPVFGNFMTEDNALLDHKVTFLPV